MKFQQKKIVFVYRPIHKILPKFSAFINRNSVKFYVTDFTRGKKLKSLLIMSVKAWGAKESRYFWTAPLR